MAHALTFESFTDTSGLTATDFDPRKALSEPIVASQVQPIIPSKATAETLLKAYASQSSYMPCLLVSICQSAENAGWPLSQFDFLKNERAYFLQHPHTTFEMHYEAFLMLHITNIRYTKPAEDLTISPYTHKDMVLHDLEAFFSAIVELIRTQPARYQTEMSTLLISAISRLADDYELFPLRTSRTLQRQLLHAVGNDAHRALGKRFDASVHVSASEDDYALFTALHAEPPASAEDPSLRLLETYMSNFLHVRTAYKIYSATGTLGPFDGHIVAAHIARTWPAKNIALLSQKVRARILMDVIIFADYSVSKPKNHHIRGLVSRPTPDEKAMFFRQIHLPADTDFHELILKFGSSLDLAVVMLSGWVNKSIVKHRWGWQRFLTLLSSTCARMDRMDLVSQLEIAQRVINESGD